MSVLSVVPLRVIPPPSAVVLVGVATEPSSIFLSSTLIVVELTVVVVPLTVKSPAIVTVPDAFPIFKDVAAPPKLIVVAVVLSKSKDVLPVVKLVVIDGDVPNTSTPDPVSSDITPARSDDVDDAN